tara:strand:+ start:4074 stop:5234 length:1161 start_codon:yes stop_codon:yes gene_type:complete
MKQTSIAQSANSYRRGVIFGLTMAEVFLLLIFCLLLFLATLQNKINELSNQNSTLNIQVQKISKNLQVSNARYAENIKTLNKSTSVPKEVFDLVNVMDNVALRKLVENSEIASSYTPEELNEVFAKADEWDTLTNQPQNSELDTLLNFAKALSSELLSKLVKNSEIASSYTPEDLNKMIKSADSWDHYVLQPKPVEKKTDPYIEELIASVSVEDLELLAAGKLEPLGNNWPPIISLPEAEDFSFEIGSAQLTETFKERLDNQIVKKILTILSEYEADLIEVIGHTDLQPMSRARITNLDSSVLNFFATPEQVGLSARDNAGLGYARALSVTKHLLQTPELENYTILPYSAAQMVTPNDTITNENDDFDSSQLRRIEIRVRRQNRSR